MSYLPTPMRKIQALMDESGETFFPDCKGTAVLIIVRICE
jgi:hypothetical protein